MVDLQGERSSLLDSAIAAYVEGLGERELDTPFRALLRAEGFFDIAFVHGASEFGRDFVAKRCSPDGRVRQYHFQNKAGDINQAAFRDVRAQLEDIRTVPLRHPLVDATIDSVMVLVSTGRLKGDAREAADGYSRTLPEGWQLQIWTSERLIEKFRLYLQAALEERASGPLLALIGAIDERLVDQRAIERHSRRWVPDTGATVSPGDVIEAALVAARLRATGRLDLACHAALGVVRAQLAALAGSEGVRADAATELSSAGEFFATYAEELWSRCGDDLLRPNPMVHVHREFGFWVTYPVRCMQTAELIALLGLWKRRRGENAQELVAWLEQFLELQPGCAHPVSDRYAVALLAPSMLLSDRRSLLTRWLREVVRWTADRYEDEGRGLAGADACPEQEVNYLLGDLDLLDLPRRRESLIAGVLLDLASILELPDVYDDARHEFYAVEVVPEVRHPPVGREAWLRDGAGTQRELNAPYADAFEDTPSWQTAPHHHQGSAPSNGLAWESLAAWALMRDRWSAPVLRELAVST